MYNIQHLTFHSHSPILLNSSPPDAYSKNKHSSVLSVLCPKYFMMCGWDKALCIAISFLIESFASGWSFVLIIFTAKTSLVSSLIRSFTYKRNPPLNKPCLKKKKLNYEPLQMPLHPAPERLSIHQRIVQTCLGIWHHFTPVELQNQKEKNHF